MKNIKLLDCTLRDGGYINDWNFGHKTIVSIIDKLVKAGIDYVEVGFFRDCEYSQNCSLFNNNTELKKVLPSEHGRTEFSSMSLHNKYDISKLEDYDGTGVGIVRVTFHNYDIDEGLAYAKKIIDKGYKCFCNPINIMGYDDKQLIELIGKINEIKPYAFSIVDTFGSMVRADLQRIYAVVEHNLDKSIVIGLHLHENLCLSYALAQDFCNMLSPTRNAVIDGSLLGMGRVPGNLCIELIADYFNRMFNADYDINYLLDAIDEHIQCIKDENPWGYSIAYALSAKYNLHRNYAEYLLNKGQLKINDINYILSEISEEKKSAFDESYVNELYNSYRNIEVDDSKNREALKQIIGSRNILILAPGSTINTHSGKINKFINANEPVIISANFKCDMISSDIIFFSNEKRYTGYDNINNSRLMITSNIHNIAEGSMVFNYHSLSSSSNGIFDNCVIMLMKLLKALGYKRVYVAGFDGYKENGNNYYETYLKNNYNNSAKKNEAIADQLRMIMDGMDVSFLTPSEYLN